MKVYDISEKRYFAVFASRNLISLESLTVYFFGIASLGILYIYERFCMKVLFNFDISVKVKVRFIHPFATKLESLTDV